MFSVTKFCSISSCLASSMANYTSTSKSLASSFNSICQGICFNCGNRGIIVPMTYASTILKSLSPSQLIQSATGKSKISAYSTTSTQEEDAMETQGCDTIIVALSHSRSLAIDELSSTSISSSVSPLSPVGGSISRGEVSQLLHASCCSTPTVLSLDLLPLHLQILQEIRGT